MILDQFPLQNKDGIQNYGIWEKEKNVYSLCNCATGQDPGFHIPFQQQGQDLTA